MFHLLLLVFVMNLDNIYFWKISTDDDIEKWTMWVGRLGSAGAFRPDLEQLPFLLIQWLENNNCLVCKQCAISAWKHVRTFIRFKTAINFNQMTSSPQIRSIKSLIAMFIHNLQNEPYT